ncbi:uncharacterized protein LOC106143302 isoform X2 [Amyelois transitella]|uniref:uncharacterized protein LOC106143302 isoform X2 n=1 Tax=Amyelois transitella TaxID=680683 RepID=UPI00298FD2D0|nr:uncharacterized protein LOC106143302 isoform X2 [Amyelois transitella]
MLATFIVTTFTEKHERKRRYLLFTPSTQWGVFITVSMPLHPETTVSVAWFLEANYYNVDNATYFEPLLGDIATLSRNKRSVSTQINGFTRSFMYTALEKLLQNHGAKGRPCLLRAICENATSHLLHDGLVGDLLHLLLTPSTSMSEDALDDIYYEAEYLGMDGYCDHYADGCPTNPLDLMSVFIEKL